MVDKLQLKLFLLHQVDLGSTIRLAEVYLPNKLDVADNKYGLAVIRTTANLFCTIILNLFVHVLFQSPNRTKDTIKVNGGV